MQNNRVNHIASVSSIASLASMTALVLLLGACGQADTPAASSASVKDTSLPKECEQAEAAQRSCTEHMASGYERLGQAAGARQLRDAFTKDMEATRTRWRDASDKEGLARSCATMRDSINAQPQCKG
ncbi:hypothetical protein OR16_35537 [Cupriavidus basilensis OR16]|uniref:Lipoprotein n=1 Tax=Cupriavidus basilensis OR16 TaxID=1127483 RepID=H1SFI6_9BURK|nr:hypothetical protein [Cupriavidus basilensis]EHP38718.1 hypothetical protein OR16_35537 [Cupriavidus basilensis OR16]